jgi:glutamine synthetase
MKEDPVVRAALGTRYADYYEKVKREEWRVFNQSVTDWEITQYLPTY